MGWLIFPWVIMLQLHMASLRLACGHGWVLTPKRFVETGNNFSRVA